MAIMEIRLAIVALLLRVELLSGLPLRRGTDEMKSYDSVVLTHRSGVLKFELGVGHFL